MSATFQILITTYGDLSWTEIAQQRALPSCHGQEADVISVGHYPDLAIGPARNELVLERGECDWLIFLDADDELRHGYVKWMRHEVAKAKSDLLLLQPRTQYVRNGHAKPPRFIRRRQSLQDDNHLIVGTGISRRLFEQVGGFGDYPHGFEDWSLWAKAWKAGGRIVDVPRSVYIAHVNEDSAHRTAWRDRRWQTEMHHTVRRDIFPELYT